MLAVFHSPVAIIAAVVPFANGIWRSPAPIRRWASWPQRLGRSAQTLLVAFAIIFLILTFTPLTIWWAHLLQGGEADSATGEVMVVLASSGMEDILGEGSYRRAAFALTEAHRAKYRRIIVSGGGGGDLPAATPMKAFLVAGGVDANIIQMEGQSKSTRENAQFTAKLLQGETRTIALVTSDFHMFRSARLFDREGIHVQRRPYPDAAAHALRWRSRFEIACELALETTKILYYKLRLWI
jgi:uncharacterized SAM-binding protein YcdF (DUF218 family)